MKNISFIKKIFIGVIMLNVIIFGIYGFLIWDIRAENQRASQLHLEADANVKKNDALRAIKQSLDENKDFLSQIDSFFVGPDGVVTFINGLEALGKDSGVKLGIGGVDVVTDKKILNPFSEDLNVKLSMSGTWENIFYFLSRVQNLPYRVEIKGATISLQGAADAIKFTDGLTRKRAPDEVWKGEFDIKVLKLK